MRHLITSILLVSFSFFYSPVNAQDGEVDSMPKMDLNFYFNVTGNNKIETNYSNGTKNKEVRISAISGLFSIYPIAYKKIQFGLGFGFERVNVDLLDTLSITENRVPLLAIAKFNLVPSNGLFLKAQLGTALTLESMYTLSYNNTDSINERTDIGAPILANIGVGIVLPIQKVKVGVEFGYAYKQLGYKKENRYNNGAVFMGVLVSLP